MSKVRRKGIIGNIFICEKSMKYIVIKKGSVIIFIIDSKSLKNIK